MRSMRRLFRCLDHPGRQTILWYASAGSTCGYPRLTCGHQELAHLEERHCSIHIKLSTRSSRSSRCATKTHCLKVDRSYADVAGVILSAATARIAQDFNVSILKAETLGTYQLLAVGASCAASCVLARLFGKRPVYILSGCIELASCIWTGAGQSFNSVLGSRVLYGLGAGAFESIVISSIGDMYFVRHPDPKIVLVTDNPTQVHQRGRRIAFYNLLGLGCAQLSPILGGYLTDKYGWRIQAWILVAFWATTAIAIFFGVPESNYIRSFKYETDLRSTEKDSDSNSEQGIHKEAEDEFEGGPSNDPSLSYLQRLKPFNGIDTRSNPISLMLRLLLCALYPAVWWTFLVSNPKYVLSGPVPF